MTNNKIKGIFIQKCISCEKILIDNIDEDYKSEKDGIYYLDGQCDGCGNKDFIENKTIRVRKVIVEG